MKKLRVPAKKTTRVSSYQSSYENRRITLGIALVLLGVLIVINLLTVSVSYQVEPVQGADIYQTQ